MRLSELIDVAQAAMDTHGDMAVFLPCPGVEVDEGIYPATQVKVRQAGNKFIQPELWAAEDRRYVFVVA